MMSRKCRVMRLLMLAVSAALVLSLCSCELLQSSVPQTDVPPVQVTQTGTELPAESEMTLKALIEQLNSERRQSDEADYELEDYLPEYTSEDFLADEFTDGEFAMLTAAPGRAPDQLSYEQAAEDVDYLFRILRTSYGAYTLLGGDEAFGAAREEMLAQLQRYYSGGITPADLRALMLSSLSFVEDTHFGLDNYGVAFDEKRCCRGSKEYVFRRDENGFYITVAAGNAADGRRYYLSEEDEQWLGLTIAEDGKLVYGFFALADQYDHSCLPDSLLLKSTDGYTVQLEPEWSVMSCNYEPGEDYYTYSEVDGIPVIALNTYYLDEYSFEDINAYLNDAKALRDEEVIIVDLRCNTGGYDSLSAMWLYNLTGGEDIDWGVGYASYISRLNEYVLTSNEAEVDALFEQLDFFDDHPDYWSDGEEEEVYYAGDTYLVEPESDYFEYDGTVFVLFNKHTYSAGELALFQFENLSNVVFVGMNSNGCLLTGGTNMDAPVWLPNSGISVNYSILLVTSEIMDGFDSYGFQPDIIVEDATAVQDIVDCWNYYNQE